MTRRVCRNGAPLPRRHDDVSRAARRAGHAPVLFGYTDVAADPRDYDPGNPALSTCRGVLPGMAVRILHRVDALSGGFLHQTLPRFRGACPGRQ